MIVRDSLGYMVSIVNFKPASQGYSERTISKTGVGGKMPCSEK